MNRTHWILIGLLALQVALLGATSLGSGPGGAGEPRTLLPDLEAATASRIEIEDGEANRLTLVRDTGAWTIDGADGYPADDSKVEQLLDQLGSLKVRRPVVSSSRYHSALEVTDDDHDRRVRIFDTDKEEPAADLLVGSSPNYGIHHVRVQGDERVYETRGIKPHEMRPEPGSWIRKEILVLEPEQVTELRLTNAHGEVRLVRQDGTWSMAGGGVAAIDAEEVDSFLRTVCNLRIVEPAGRTGSPELGLDSPVAQVELSRTSAEETQVVTLRIGAETSDGEGRRFVALEDADFAGVLSKWDADQILEQKADEFHSED